MRGLPLVLLLLVAHTAWAVEDRPADALEAVAASARSKTFVGEVAIADVQPHIEYLAAPELRGRAGAERILAARYIIAHWRKLGLEPLFPGGRYDQEIPGKRDDSGNAPVIGRNIGAILRGSDPALANEWIIVSAHYDHLGVNGREIFAGADDNASGTSMMMALAEKFAQRKHRLPCNVAFVGFDLEEHLLWGSRWFAAHPPWPLANIRLFLTADMIGRSLGDLPLPAVFVLGSEHGTGLKEMLDGIGHPEGLEVARLGTDLIGTRSDYGPFRDRDVPYLFFSTGEHPDYHTPRDTPNRIDFDKVARVSSLVLRIVEATAHLRERPQWKKASTNDLDEPRALERITTLLLEAEKTRPLSDLQRYMVTTVQNRTRRILERGEMTTSDRTWLIRMSQLLLLSVF